MKSPTIRLSPTQEKVVAALHESLPFGRITVIWGASGLGKTTMLNHLRETKFQDAPSLSTIDFLAIMQNQNPFALEEAYATMLLNALEKHDVLLVDDLHLLNDALCCGYGYPRKDYFVGPLTAVMPRQVAWTSG